jgi:hypothetical protein
MSAEYARRQAAVRKEPVNLVTAGCCAALEDHQKSDSVRHTIAFSETMKRLHGEIERYLYSAEIVCGNLGDEICKESECSFFRAPTKERPLFGCNLVTIRCTIGDHFEQHDIPQVQP